jgi:hypothetical protein
MAAPKGNQYALGNEGGRPREHDRIAYAKSLDEWSKQDNALTLLSWINLNNLYDEVLVTWSQECDEFARALKRAKNRIGERRELLANKGEYNYGIYSRAATIYDTTLRLHERADKEHDYELKKQLAFYEAQLRQSGGEVDEDIREKYDNLMNQLSSLQSSRKTAAKSKSKDK